MLSKVKENKFFIFFIFYFFLQNNFVLTSILSRSQGLGFGLLRSLILPLCFLFPVIYIFFSFLHKIFNKNFLKYKINYHYTKYTFFFLVLIFFRSIADYIISSKVDLIGVIPLIEAVFLLITLIYLFPEKDVQLKKYQITLISYFIFINIFFEIVIYFYDVFHFVSYGPFRSYIAGITINRNPSFIFPLLGLIVLLEYNFTNIIKKIFVLIFTIYLVILFYRTLYVALFFVYILYLYNNGYKFNFINLIQKLILFLLFFFIFNFFVTKYFDFDILSLFFKRIGSIFAEEEDYEDAKSGRIVQIPLLFYEIIKNPFGMGFNGEINTNPIYNYAYYQLQIIMYLGWTAIPYLYIIHKNIFKKIFIKGNVRFFNYAIIYLTIIMIFFPYCSYFSIASLFIFSYFFTSKNFILK